MATEKYANFAVSILTDDIDDSVTSLTVADSSSFPSAGDFRILIGEELMLVTGVSSNTFTVIRGVENTTPAQHSSGDRVVHLLTKAALDNRARDNYVMGAYADRPTIERAGQMYFCTDYPCVLISDGINWLPYGPIFYCKRPPATNWSWIAQNSATVVHDLTGTTISGGLTNNSNWRLISRPLTYTTKYSIIIGIIDQTAANNNNSAYAVGVRVVGGNYAYLRSAGTLYYQKRNSSFASPSNITQSQLHENLFTSGICWYKFQNDGTNLITYISNDKVNWSRFSGDTLSNLFGSGVPDEFVLGLYHDVLNVFNPYITLVHYEEVDDG